MGQKGGGLDPPMLHNHFAVFLWLKVAFIVREMSLKPVDACDRLNYCIPDDVKPQEAADLQQEPSIEDSGRSGQEAWAKRAGSVLDILYDSAREGVRDKRHATSRVSHQKKLDDAIKVAHVTDFHVDKKYFEVSSCQPLKSVSLLVGKIVSVRKQIKRRNSLKMSHYRGKINRKYPDGGRFSSS